MDWMYVDPEDSAQQVCQNELGFYVGDKYKIAVTASASILSLCNKLATEDKSLRTFRRKLGFSQIVQKDLAPILVECDGHENWDVFAATTKLLMEMTTPLECLFVSMDHMDHSDEVTHILFELKQHLSEIKNIFLDSRISRSILTQLEKLLNKSTPLSHNEKHCLLNCITLMRNVLHIPENASSSSSNGKDGGDSSTTASRESTNACYDANSGDGDTTTGSTKINSNRQHQILWNLFAHNLDSVIMSAIESQDFKMWSTSLVQLIALVYKDQHVGTLERLLNIWLESSLSDSSEDNESNTSPQHIQDGNGSNNGFCSSSLLTSTEPNSTDDSSDGNGNHSGNGDGTHSDKGTYGSSGEAPSPQSNVEMEAIGTDLNTKEEPKTTLETVMVACEVDDDDAQSTTDSIKEPPRKKVALEAVIQINKPEETKKKVIETDSGMGSVTGKDSSDSSLTPSNSKMKTKGIESTTSDKPKVQTKSGSSSSSSSNCDMKENQDMDMEITPNNNTKSSDKKESSEEGYGYVSTQAINLKPKTEQESNSTSSNEDGEIGRKRNITPHTNLQKPRPKKKIISTAEKRELRRKKLIERSKSKSLKVKALVHHVPTDEDIADLLKEFTVDFLLKGYPSLVMDLRKQLMSDEDADIDKSHFLWLITYFLKFASQLEVEWEQIGSVLSVETVAYLTYEGVRFFEELELAVREQRERAVDLRPHLRRIHLVVTALREFIQTLQIYSKFTHFTDIDKKKLRNIQIAVCGMRDLRQLFLLLIRRYNSSLQTRQYLTDAICGNHALLVMIENTKMDVDIMTSHLTQFATVEVMRQYGKLLEGYYSNTESVNDCIFTMMHHVCGDLNTPETLFIPQVLETFSDIWEREDVEICDDWADLIEYVIQKFISTIGSRPHAYASNVLECINNSEAMDENGFTRLQLEHLYSYYTQFEDAPDPVECIIEIYKRTSNVSKTRLAVIQALLSQGIISLAQYMNMMYMKSVLTPCKAEHEGSVVVEVGSERCDSEGHDTDIENAHDLNPQNKDQIETLKELLKKQGKDCLLTWLQQTLLDACCVKVNGNELFKPDGESLEPVPYHFNYINQSIPMVSWSKSQESGLQTETFMLLLHKFGFHLATDVGKCFPRIPHFWSADHLYQLALKVGPLRKEDLRMDLTILEKAFCSDNTQDSGCNLNSPSTSIMKTSAETDPAAIEIPVSETIPFAVPTPTNSWIQMALNSKRASVESKSNDVNRPVTHGDSTSKFMEKMQISEDCQ